MYHRDSARQLVFLIGVVCAVLSLFLIALNLWVLMQ